MILALAGQPGDGHYFSFAEDLAIWSAVVFVLLVVLLIKFGCGPVFAMLSRRQKSIVESLRQAEIAREEIERLRQEQQAKLAQSKEAAKALLVEAKADAERTKVEIARRIESEVERIKQRSGRELQLAKQKALHEICQTATELTIRTAERIVRENLTAADHRRLIGDALDRIRDRSEVAA